MYLYAVSSLNNTLDTIYDTIFHVIIYMSFRIYTWFLRYMYVVEDFLYVTICRTMSKDICQHV